MSIICKECGKVLSIKLSRLTNLCNRCLLDNLITMQTTTIKQLDVMTLNQLRLVVKSCNVLIMSGKRMIDTYHQRN